MVVGIGVSTSGNSEIKIAIYTFQSERAYNLFENKSQKFKIFISYMFDNHNVNLYI